MKNERLRFEILFIYAGFKVLTVFYVELLLNL
jgi:hypothetical protein